MDLIKRLAISDPAILVTSYYEEEKIRQQAEAINTKILPKDFSPYVPIIVDDFKHIDLVFIDDDETLTAAWEERAKNQDISILTFNDIDDFQKFTQPIDKETPIYIDSSLNSSVKGEIFAKQLYDQGFSTLYLATGYPADNFKNLYWIKKIVGKEPPF